MIRCYSHQCSGRGAAGGALAGAILLACVLLASPALGLQVGSPETWQSGSTEGWTCYDAVNETSAPPPSVDGGALRLVFKKQAMKMPPEEYVLRAGSTASGGRFVGDYVSNVVTEISFRLLCEYPVEVSAVLCSARGGRLWRYTVPSQTTGVWTTVRIPIDPRALKVGNSVDGLSAFAGDLSDVTWVGVSIQRNGSVNAQAFWIDDFAVSGPGIAFSQWIAQFPDPPTIGSGSCNRLPSGDLDGDGFDNYSEWLAGTSAGDAKDCLVVTVDSNGQTGGAVVKWSSKSGRRYMVWRATDLRKGFQPISAELPATPPENAFEDATATGDGPYFYRSQVTGVESP